MILSHDEHCIPCSAAAGEAVERDSCSSLTHPTVPKVSANEVQTCCQLCETVPLVIIDAPTRHGPWAFQCFECWNRQRLMGAVGTTHINVGAP